MRAPDPSRSASRRDFLRWLGAGALLPLHGIQASMQDSLAGRGATGTLRDPSAVGRPHSATDPAENNAEIQAIEQRLACNCGCTLDVFTCRTTDFSCTYSPRLHREVLALRAQGKNAQQILDAFVAKYGEKALMAPKAQGFNWLGYLVPGTAIVLAGGVLLAVIGRRKASTTAADAAAQPGSGGVDQVAASPEELERVRQALAEVED